MFSRRSAADHKGGDVLAGRQKTLADDSPVPVRIDMFAADPSISGDLRERARRFRAAGRAAFGRIDAPEADARVDAAQVKRVAIDDADDGSLDPLVGRRYARQAARSDHSCDERKNGEEFGPRPAEGPRLAAFSRITQPRPLARTPRDRAGADARHERNPCTQLFARTLRPGGLRSH
nr:hypothetical protein [Amphiplicatus metriothermophilus]